MEDSDFSQTGSVGILNVGAGDIRLSFDPANPVERIRAGRVVKDMLKRGYALLVEVERDGQKAFERATDFDEKTGSYLIADFDPVEAYQARKREREQQEAQRGQSEQVKAGTPDGGAATTESAPRPRRGRPPKYKKVPASGTRAVAVGRSAGG